MTTTANKTIIITAIRPESSNQRLLLSGYKMSSILDSTSVNQRKKHSNVVSSDDSQDTPVRKRQRLDHLSSDEKLMRRKLKNRVAAQSARDRKRVQMSELETDVEQLKKENQKLQNENTLLKLRNKNLEDKVTNLRLVLDQRIGTSDKVDNQTKASNVDTNNQSDISDEHTIESDSVSDKENSDSIEYASLISDSQQKRQDPIFLSVLMMLSIYCQTIMMTTSYWMCYENYRNSSTKLVSQSRTLHRKKQTSCLELMKNPMLKRWWGPQQSNWNPSKNL